MAVKPQVGLLGGSFDPVHTAHIGLALAAIQALSLEQVQLLPAGLPWQKGQLGASANDRLAMLRLASSPYPQLHINPIELQRSGATYTIDTLTALPDSAQYTWIMGADQLANFCNWHRWRDIIQYVRLAVAQRPGTTLTIPPSLEQLLPDEGLVRIPFPPQDIAASTIRLALAQGQTHIPELDPLVLDYIHTHQLYQQPSIPGA
ncbi:nicotinate (nicotinamide) nucleotide adenylyltransferase [Castellaniella sp.]|uniref:nicotinate (nicotinamide) nucleotide adenylyltransferase n=1 Tax=Castellaniella sp. TaxID=1955812 RepID=UPI002AFFE082|nr:nicotinate (nicotinamide) nucleotide adenylyltransferase [Castellaniella sp.]